MLRALAAFVARHFEQYPVLSALGDGGFLIKLRRALYGGGNELQYRQQFQHKSGQSHRAK
ncbi:MULTISPECIES: hypothetical protein [unclassified Sphingomonas]|uniref:hypothetical protein n=1 Tax=unclassified Sphingomonas TaxID=196159 RepID=UPI0010F68C6F|nr:MULTISPECIES: hypothetical protein [unclassified Sphingomonas]